MSDRHWDVANDNECDMVKRRRRVRVAQHDDTDELFLILEGEFDIDFRDRTYAQPGELFVPRDRARPAARARSNCC